MTGFIHSGAWTERAEGLCRWRHHAFGQDLRCTDTAIPGGDECATHLIERMQAPARPWSRWDDFGDAA